MVRHLAVLAFAVWAGSAQASSWAEPLFSERAHDFGAVARGPTLYHSFVITNRTSETLHVGPLRIPCGCVKAAVARNVLAPGESTSLDASLATAGSVGLLRKVIYVPFGAAGVEVMLSLQATVHDDVILSPSSLDFGQVRSGKATEASVTVRFRQRGGYRLLNLKADSGYLQVRSQALPGGPDGEGFQVTAQVRPDLPPGRWHSAVWASTNHPAAPTLRIPVTIEVSPGLRASSVSLGQVKAGVEVTRRLLVTADAPFRITTVKGANGLSTVPEWADERKTAHVITLRLKPGAPGPVAGTIRVVTDRQGTNHVDVPVTGAAVP